MLAQPSSKFQAAVVDSGACLSAGLNWQTQLNTGPITLSFRASTENADRCLAALQGELAKFATPGYVTTDELHRAAHELELSLVKARQRGSDFAHDLTFWWTSAGLPYYFGYLDHCYEVDGASVAHYVAAFLTKQPFVFGVLVNPAMKKAGLDQPHFAALLGVKGAK